MSAATTPSIEHVDPSSMVAVWRSLVFTVWGHRPLTPAVAEKHVLAMEKLGKALGLARTGTYVMLDIDVPTPESELRAFLDKSVPRVAPYYCCSGTVFAGDGFRGALVRGVLSSFQLVAPKKYPQRVFSTHDECARWMRPHLVEAGMKLESHSELLEVARYVEDAARREGVFSKAR